MATRSQSARASRAAPPPTNLDKAETASPNTFLGKIVKVIYKTCDDLVQASPDYKSNTGRILGELFFWGEVRKYSEAKYEALREKCIMDSVFEETAGLVPGNHVISESSHFVVQAAVTAKVMRFSRDKLAELLLEKYKIPVIVTKDLCERSVVPTKSQVKITIAERG